MCVGGEVSIYVSLFCVWLLNTNTLEKELLRLARGRGGRGAVSQNWLNVVCFSSTSR